MAGDRGDGLTRVSSLSGMELEGGPAPTADAVSVAVVRSRQAAERMPSRPGTRRCYGVSEKPLIGTLEFMVSH